MNYFQQPGRTIINMTNNQQRSILTRLLILLAGFTVASAASARSYDVEIIVFEHVRETNVGSSDTLLLPVVRDAQTIPPVPTGTDPAQSLVQSQEPNLPIQSLKTLRLSDHAEKIKQSPGHRLMYHGGWRQIGFDQETAPYMRIALGTPVPMFTEPGDADSIYLKGYVTPPLNSNIRYNEKRTTTLYGGIKVWVGRFLHFETLLSYTPQGANQSFAIESGRRMRSRQIHYIDNPRVGIITKIFPVDETAPN